MRPPAKKALLMLDFADQPFRWFPPKRSPLIAPLLRRYNARRFLPKAKRILEIDSRHVERLQSEAQPGDRFVFMPNHPTHADAAIFMEVLRRLDQPAQLMAAYDVYLRSRLEGWMIQRIGAFSVDRDAADPRPMKHALEVLAKGRCALTVFPEGNVYLENDRVGPFLEGAAFLALRAQQAMGEDGGRVLAVPVSIKATHIRDAHPAVRQRLRRIAEAIGVERPGKDEDPREALARVGMAALERNLSHRGIALPQGGTLADTIRSAAAGILDRLESKLSLTSDADAPLIERVRQCRRVIHEVRTDSARAADHAAAATWADEAMLAFRIASYRGDYVAERPSLDRVSETVEKLEEDVFSRMPAPMGDRLAVVSFGTSIDLRERLAQSRKLRPVVRSVTADVEAAVQQGLDEINGTLDTWGSRPWK